MAPNFAKVFLFKAGSQSLAVPLAVKDLSISQWVSVSRQKKCELG